jgi:hypothetical protein
MPEEEAEANIKRSPMIQMVFLLKRSTYRLLYGDLSFFGSIEIFQKKIGKRMAIIPWIKRSPLQETNCRPKATRMGMEKIEKLAAES